MHLKSLAFILVLCYLGIAVGHASPASSQLYRLAYYKAPNKVRKIEQVDDFMSHEQLEIENEDEDDDDDDFLNVRQLAGSRQQSASTGRLFFKRLFGQQQNQPQIIPIVINGNGNNGNNGVTSTGVIPQATGTLQTTPLSRGYAESDTDGIQVGPEAYDEEEKDVVQGSLVAGAQEYVVTDQAVKGTAADGSSIVHKLPTNVNLRRPGKTGSVVSLHIPAGYRKYFKNGQKILLSAPNNRRRRRNNNRNNRRRKIRN